MLLTRTGPFFLNIFQMILSKKKFPKRNICDRIFFWRNFFPFYWNILKRILIQSRLKSEESMVIFLSIFFMNFELKIDQISKYKNLKIVFSQVSAHSTSFISIRPFQRLGLHIVNKNTQKKLSKKCLNFFPQNF